jgi:hypothetical protein
MLLVTHTTVGLDAIGLVSKPSQCHWGLAAMVLYEKNGRGAPSEREEEERGISMRLVHEWIEAINSRFSSPC